jgi:hypothetical protein
VRVCSLPPCPHPQPLSQRERGDVSDASDRLPLLSRPRFAVDARRRRATSLGHSPIGSERSGEKRQGLGGVAGLPETDAQGHVSLLIRGRSKHPGGRPERPGRLVETLLASIRLATEDLDFRLERTQRAKNVQAFQGLSRHVDLEVARGLGHPLADANKLCDLSFHGSPPGGQSRLGRAPLFDRSSRLTGK